MNGSWGYDRDNQAWKSTEMLVQMLVDTVSKGGNLLLNVGPNGRGAFEPKALDRLRGVGEWLRLHGRAVYGCTASAFTPPPECRYTQNGDRLYLHLFTWPFRHVHLDGLASRVEYAQLLSDASEVGLRVLDPDQGAQIHHHARNTGHADARATRSAARGRRTGDRAVFANVSPITTLRRVSFAYCQRRQRDWFRRLASCA